ncbi:MAG: ribose-5-phosphate isomerase A [bacterium]|nr:MAG: ribose-5-phosphate isomerase A [bacterium]
MIVNETKLFSKLGVKRVVFVDVIPFASKPALEYLKSLSANVKFCLTKNNESLQTDRGSFIIDWKFDYISQPPDLTVKLKEK